MMMTQEQALERLNGNDLLQLGMDAGDVRQSLWPEPVVTYTVGYQVEVGSGVPLVELSAAIDRGATGLLLSAVPGASLAAVAEDLSAIHSRFPELALTGFSPAQVAGLGDATDTFKALRNAGLVLFGSAVDAAQPDAAAAKSSSSLSPTSPSITDKVGQGFSPGHPEPLPGGAFAPGGHEGWLAIHRAAHQSGLQSVAVLELRSSDTAKDWVALLEQVVTLQSETTGFLACEPRIEQMERALDEVTGAQYLKMVALCRLYLDTIPHLQVDWSIFGPKVLQVALRFGADDAGLVLANERNRKVPSHHSGEEELRRIIRDAGFQPSQRDAIYGRQFVY
jgi:cyclic dehypoxanthinyl futalosine synthase